MKKYFRSLTKVILSLGLILGFSAYLPVWAMDLEYATVFSQPRAIAPFKLQDDKGEHFSNANLKGHWSLLFFGFTNCAMICPTTMTELNKMYQLLTKAKEQVLPQVVFISVDPERDTLKRLHNYVHAFNPNFVGVTGDEKELAKLAKNVGAMYMKVVDKDDPNQYYIDHSAFIILVNPEGHMYGIFSSPHEADNMAKNFVAISKS